MVGSVLRVVLQDEHDGFLPGGAFAQVIEEHAHGQVVVRDVGEGRRPARGRSLGMVVGQPYRHQRRQHAGRYQGVEFPGPLPDA